MKHIPYFYIIQHIGTERLYAGARWAVGCYPEELLTLNGYHTSSLVIKQIISEEGLDSFKIVRTMTEDECGVDVYYYETRFLQDYNISSRLNWFNAHNNDYLYATFGTEQFRYKMIQKYDVPYAMQSEILKAKAIETCISKYGVPLVTSE